MGVAGKIGGRPVELRTGGQQIPENLADAAIFETHI